MNSIDVSYAEICKIGAKVNTQTTNPTPTFCDFEHVRTHPQSNEDIPSWAKCCGWRRPS